MLIIKNAMEKKVVFFVAAAFFLAGCGPPAPRALRAGRQWMERGRYEEALEPLTRATALLNNTNAVAWEYLGLAYQYLGRTTNAVQAYQRALALDRNLMEARYNLGCLWLDEKRPELAKAEFIIYTAFQQASADGWVRLGTAQLRSVKPGPAASRLAEISGAEKSFGEAIQLDPKNCEAWNGLGLAQVQRGHFREALQSFNRALQQQPQYAPALLNSAILLQVYLNDPSQALAKYRDYLALPARGPDWESVKAIVRALEAETRAASMPAAPERVSAPPEKPADGHQTATSVKSEAGPEQHALPAATSVPPASEAGGTATAVPRAAEPAAIPVPAASVPQKDAETPAAGAKPGFFSRLNPFNWSSKGAASNPGSDVNRYAYRAPVKPAPGNRAAAVRAFAQGVQAQKANHLTEAIQAYRQATQLDPAYYDPYYNLSLAAAGEGNLPQALAACETALAIQPDSANARYNFALLLMRAKYPADAANELEKLIAANPNENRARLALGNLYAQVLHQPAKAREQYQKLLELDPQNPQAPAIRLWLSKNP